MLGKFLFLSYGPKCSQSIRLQDSQTAISQEQNDELKPDFLYVDTNSRNKKRGFENCWGGPGQTCVFAYQIAGFLKRLYLKNELMN